VAWGKPYSFPDGEVLSVIDLWSSFLSVMVLSFCNCEFSHNFQVKSFLRCMQTVQKAVLLGSQTSMCLGGQDEGAGPGLPNTSQGLAWPPRASVGEQVCWNCVNMSEVYRTPRYALLFLSPTTGLLASCACSSTQVPCLGQLNLKPTH
jgi:hypothetical protein